MYNKLTSVLLIVLLSTTSFSLFNGQDAYATVATGGAITYADGYTIHSFTSSGTFTVTSSGVVEYLIIGGGGAGAGSNGAGDYGVGAGGSGGWLEGIGHAVTVQGYAVTVGAGGTGGTVADGGSGGNSVFDALTAIGGGGGDGDAGGGLNGGSGGGSKQNTAPGTGSQGNDGGDSTVSSAYGGGAGGSYAAVGGTGTTTNGGAGAVGTSNSITGVAVIRAGGGGGSIQLTGTGGTADTSSGATAGTNTGAAIDATANTGSGGGGSQGAQGGDGGSGIVIIRYLTNSSPAPDAITDLTFTNLGGNTLDLIWTEPGLNTGNVTNYMLNSTTPQSSVTSFLGNSTSLFFNVTGLDWGKGYSFSASVLTEGGYNFTGNVLNLTTASPVITGVAPTDLVAHDGDHSVDTILNLEWVADLMENIDGFRIFFETPIGNGFTTLTANTTTTTLYYNDTGLTPGVFYNYKVAALNASGLSENSTAYAATPHKLSDWVTDLTITPNDLLQFLAEWSAPTLWGTLLGYQINYTTPAGDPQTIYTSTNPTTSALISGLDPTVEYSIRVASNTNHGINASGSNISNGTLTSDIAVGDLNFDPGVNPDVEPIWFENYILDSTTNDVQVRFDSALTVDCTVTERIAANTNTYNGISETAATGYVYHNFTVTNAGNDILDWDCYDQTDALVNGQYALAQNEAASGVGGVGNVPLFSLMANFTGGLYGTEGDFAGIDLITLFIVIISMLGFNRRNPALGVGIMATMLGAAYYFGLIPWTSGVLGGIAVVIVLAIGQGTKRD